MGIARMLDEQQPDNMTNQSAHTESVSKNNEQKPVKAKQIFLGIDAHLKSNQVARKIDNSGIQGVQSLRVEEHTSELQSHLNLVCRLLLEKKKGKTHQRFHSQDDPQPPPHSNRHSAL